VTSLVRGSAKTKKWIQKFGFVKPGIETRALLGPNHRIYFSMGLGAGNRLPGLNQQEFAAQQGFSGAKSPGLTPGSLIADPDSSQLGNCVRESNSFLDS
jgi:hypothetical protein